MKRIIISTLVTLSIGVGCGDGDKHAGNGLITVDVTKKYPTKELILQDFMEVEYIPLETTDDFICQGRILDVGTDMIIARNRAQDGNIFIFDMKGRAIKKINKRGQGAEEYASILRVVLDEENRELFVDDFMTRRILVYDLDGNFKRGFKHREKSQYDELYDFDRENLLCYDGTQNMTPENHNGQSLLIVSKQDGSITYEIHIPFEEKKTTWLIDKDETTGMNYVVAPSSCYPIVPHQDYFLLTDPSCDTIYSYHADHSMKPFAIRRPTIQSMNPEVFFFISTITDRYYFMETIIKTGDVRKQTGLPITDLLYDRKEQAIYEYSVYNDDYTTKQIAYVRSRPLNNKITSWQDLDANNLIEALKEGKLRGKLKEIAAELTEDSNPVLMLLSSKK